MAVKIAMIGAGSLGFTQLLFRDIVAVPELQDAHFALTDISKPNLNRVVRLIKRDLQSYKIPATLTATTERRRALEGADYVICMVRVGGLSAFKLDVDIPLKYGIDQCVGDTLCAGGIMYAQRSIPEMLKFCEDIRQVCATSVLFLNYANPMAMNTWACNKYGGVNTIGLCHGVSHTTQQIAKVLGLPENELDVLAAGINHQTWFLSVKHRGVEYKDRLLAAYEAHPEYSRREKVRIDMLRRFGYYSTETNGHLSEYVPWYRKRRNEIKHWISHDLWLDGETSGYLKHCIERDTGFSKNYATICAEAPPPLDTYRRSVEHASYIIESLVTGRVYRGFFNVINGYAIANLPPDCVVEVPGYVDRHGISTCALGELPLACAATCNTSVQVQRMAMEAAVHGDELLLKQAMLHDPLVGAVCNPPEVWRMVDEMLAAQAQWLPQYRPRQAPAPKHRGKRPKKELS